MKRRSVLILSPYFPPSTLAGVHRARHLVKHLPSAGWTPVVVCVDETYHEQRLDPALAQLVPPEVEIIKTGAMPARLSRRLGLGEISLRAWWPLWSATARALGSGRFQAAFITGAPFYPMLFASRIRAQFGVPVVLDFQDPWVSAGRSRLPPSLKSQAAIRLGTFLEPRALRGADFVTSVSDVQNAEQLERHPWLDAARMASLPIGGDPDDFAALRRSPPKKGLFTLDSQFINFSFVGAFMPRSVEPMRLVLRAFRSLRANHPSVAARIRFNFVGTSNSPNGGARRVAALAESEGVADVVCETPQRLPYLDALAVLARSDGVLLIGSDEPHYTASKIYPGLMSGRPFLSLFHQASSSHQILSASGGGIALAFSTQAELVELEDPLSEALLLLATNKDSFGPPDARAFEPYEARSIAKRFAEIFDYVSTRQCSTKSY